MPNRHAIRALTLSLMTAFAAAHAGTVSVVTSFPKDLTDAYKKAFEARNPTIKIEILNKNTTASIAYIKELPAGQRPDIMWASAPDAFEVLARDKLLTSLANEAWTEDDRALLEGFAEALRDPSKAPDVVWSMRLAAALRAVR